MKKYIPLLQAANRTGRATTEEVLLIKIFAEKDITSDILL